MAAIAVPFASLSNTESLARDEKLENRRMATLPPPPTSVEQWRAYPTSLTAWFDDHVGFRHALLGLRSRLYMQGSHTSPTQLIEMGREGWLFHTDNDRFADWRGLQPFTSRELTAWQGTLVRRANWLSRRDIGYVFALCPNKEWIYGEHFPSGISRVGPCRLEQLCERLRDEPALAFVDLREALLAEKQFDGDDDLVYHRLGTHWTDRGAWAGARAILDTARVRHPSLPSPERDLFTSALDEHAAQDSMGDQLYLDDALTESIRRLRPRGAAHATEVPSDPRLPLPVRHWTNDDRTLPRVVLIHDSFGPWLAPLLAEVCSDVWATASTPRNTTLIAEVRPDLVVQMYTERILRRSAVLAVMNGELIDAELEQARGREAWSATGATFVAALVPVGSASATLDRWAPPGAALVSFTNHGASPAPSRPTPRDGSAAESSVARLEAHADGDTFALSVPANCKGSALTIRLRGRARDVTRVRFTSGTDANAPILASVLMSTSHEEYVVRLGSWSGAATLGIEIEPGSAVWLESVWLEHVQIELR